MKIKEVVNVTYETEDGVVFSSLDEAREHTLKVKGNDLVQNGVECGQFKIYFLNDADEFDAFLRAKQEEGNENNFLFSFERLSYPLFICERKVVEDRDRFYVHYEFDHLSNVVAEQQRIANELEYYLNNSPRVGKNIQK